MTGTTTTKRKMPKWALIAAIAVGALVIGVAVTVPVVLTQQAEAKERAEAVAARAAAEEAEAQRLKEFETAAQRCRIRVEGIRGGGESIAMTEIGLYGEPPASSVFCFLDRIGAPEIIEEKIGQTRALDGRQSHEWDGYKAEWAYHPDDGLSLTVEHVKES